MPSEIRYLPQYKLKVTQGHWENKLNYTSNTIPKKSDAKRAYRVKQNERH